MLLRSRLHNRHGLSILCIHLWRATGGVCVLLYIVLVIQKASSIKARLAVVLTLDHTVALQKRLVLTI